MKKIAIVIFSCFKYRYLWEEVYYSWKRELKADFDKFDFFITTDNPNQSDYYHFLKDTSINFITYPNNIEWADSLIYSIEELRIKNYNRIITTFDDLFITNIDINLLRKIINKHDKFNYYKIINSHSNIYQRILSFKEYDINSQISYLGSMVMTLWNYEFLLEFLRLNIKTLSGLNAWQYEKKVPKLLSNFTNLKYQNKQIISYKNILIKGKLDMFTLYFYELVKHHKLTLIRSQYSNLSFLENLNIYLYYVLFKFMKLFLPKGIFTILSGVRKYFS